MKLFCVVFLILFHATAVLSELGCILNINRDLPRNEPILLSKTSRGNYSLILPTDGQFRFNNSQEVLLECVGPKNVFIKNKYIDSARTKCQSKNRFSIFGGSYTISELNCTHPITGDIKQTNKPCGNKKGWIIEIGYKTVNSSWNPLITVCYRNKSIAESLYSEHILYGKEINKAEHYSHRHGFKTNGLPSDMHADLAYKKSIQKVMFNRIFQSATTSDQYITPSRFLSRGHYAPDGDFLLSAWQLTTYYYINTAPQWQNINGGNWRSLENMIRKSANISKHDYHIATGSFGILTLPDRNGNEKEIYLSTENQLPVPKYWWKAVVDPKTEEGIAFVQLNNPFAKNDDDMKIFENVCESTGWVHPSWSDPSKGLIRCCRWAHLTRLIDRVPILSVNKVLNY